MYLLYELTTFNINLELILSKFFKDDRILVVLHNLNKYRELEMRYNFYEEINSSSDSFEYITAVSV